MQTGKLAVAVLLLCSIALPLVTGQGRTMDKCKKHKAEILEQCEAFIKKGSAIRVICKDSPCCQAVRKGAQKGHALCDLAAYKRREEDIR